ncbi:hypothetical protein [Lysinibacillus telephonicus]|uniref:hypothetical protein n=1 Tax=Lysinibacillus telephonicus TaxID=1714840 RepID=UPI003CCC6E82
MRKKKTGEIESFQSPIEQVKRHAEFIEGVVGKLGLSVPVHKGVVIAEPTTVIGKIPGEIPIFHAIGLRTEVKKLLLKYKKPLIADVHFELLKQNFLNCIIRVSISLVLKFHLFEKVQFVLVAEQCNTNGANLSVLVELNERKHYYKCCMIIVYY